MFDNVCKFLAETFPADFAQWLLGEPTPLTQLSPSELSLEPIRADSLILMQADPVVLQVEFQTQPDATMPFRMLDYSVRIRRRFPHKHLHQVVIYLRETSSDLVFQTCYQNATTQHTFHVIRLWEQPVEPLRKMPGLLPFAVLAKTPDRFALLQQLASDINTLDRHLRDNVAASTSILAGLVLKSELIHRVLRTETMQESVIYQEILHEGRQRGLQQGLERGKVEGERSLVEKLLKRRVGDLPVSIQAQIRELAIADLEALGEALLDFTSLDDLVAWLQQPSNP